MTEERFLKLIPDERVYMDGKAYNVCQTDSMGRVQLQHIVYYVDVWDFSDDLFDDHDAANNHLSELIEQTEDDIKDHNEQLSVLDDDDEERDDVQEELDKLEEQLDDLKFADIDTEESGDPFWMHYKDINEDDV